MPWLIKSTQGNKVPIEGHLFFVHVPRCGGTSLMQHFNVPQKVIDSRGVIGKAAMSYFFMRYKQLESANFPMKTKENAIVQSVVKQEELKLLKTRDGATEAMKQDNTISDLPDLVRDALAAHEQSQNRSKVVGLLRSRDNGTNFGDVAMDFEVFGYERTIKQRPDLIPPKKDRGVIMSLWKCQSDGEI
eukprot:scaffold7246_cov136-Skeletonema_marinoi.AAC.12